MQKEQGGWAGRREMPRRETKVGKKLWRMRRQLWMRAAGDRGLSGRHRDQACGVREAVLQKLPGKQSRQEEAWPSGQSEVCEETMVSSQEKGGGHGTACRTGSLQGSEQLDVIRGVLPRFTLGRG